MSAGVSRQEAVDRRDRLAKRRPTAWPEHARACQPGPVHSRVHGTRGEARVRLQRDRSLRSAVEDRECRHRRRTLGTSRSRTAGEIRLERPGGRSTARPNCGAGGAFRQRARCADGRTARPGPDSCRARVWCVRGAARRDWSAPVAIRRRRQRELDRLVGHVAVRRCVRAAQTRKCCLRSGWSQPVLQSRCSSGCRMCVRSAGGCRAHYSAWRSSRHSPCKRATARAPPSTPTPDHVKLYSIMPQVPTVRAR